MDRSIVKQLEKEKNNNFNVKKFVVMFIYWGTINIIKKKKLIPVITNSYALTLHVVTTPSNTNVLNILHDSIFYHFVFITYVCLVIDVFEKNE